MKRGKDEEKVMGPMFPRLHVNDTEKGGPRAPPRNKMALYEQLSIPSKRFNHSVLPLSSNSNATNIEPPSSQGVTSERGMFSPYQKSTQHQSEKLYSQYPDFSIPLTQGKQRKKSDEDDFRVPIFTQFPQNQESDRFANGENSTPSNPSSFIRPLTFHKFQKIGTHDSTTSQEDKSQKEENPKELATDQVKAASSLSTEMALGLKKQHDSSVSREPRDSLANSIDRLETHSTVQPELCDDSQHVLGERIPALDKNNSCATMRTSPSEDERSSRDLRNDTGGQDRSFRSAPMRRNMERGDSLSGTSVVDSVSRLDMTPDDVVATIGLRNFWKARKAILNQQRVFAIQVFELHRLVKVQRLIAESPQLLVDESAYLGKPKKGSFGSEITLNCPVKPTPNVSKQRDEPEKPSQKKESAAENTVGKPSFSSIQNSIPLPNGRPLNGNSQAPSVSSNPNARPPWSFNQPQGHQWLIPVMSPSEGLVYKPYPGPGFTGPGCTSPGCTDCCPPGPNPLPCNFVTPPYGIPAPHPHYQLPSFPPSRPHGYFPMYDMNGAAFSGSSAEQMNLNPRPPIPNQTPARKANVRSTPSHENRVPLDETIGLRVENWVPLDETIGLHVSKDVEVQVSTASSPVERLQDSREIEFMDRTNVLPLFPMAPGTDGPSPSGSPCRPGPIRVVPHNPRSATESAARIFRSIQEERKQYESM